MSTALSRYFSYIKASGLFIGLIVEDYKLCEEGENLLLEYFLKHPFGDKWETNFKFFFLKAFNVIPSDEATKIPTTISVVSYDVSSDQIRLDEATEIVIRCIITAAKLHLVALKIA
jgi:hypothetical protein